MGYTHPTIEPNYGPFCPCGGELVLSSWGPAFGLSSDSYGRWSCLQCWGLWEEVNGEDWVLLEEGHIEDFVRPPIDEIKKDLSYPLGDEV